MATSVNTSGTTIITGPPQTGLPLSTVSEITAAEPTLQARIMAP
jgi:hypothetical protein